MGTTSSAPARDSRGDLRQRAAQQAQQPRYTARPGYANAPQPFQGQQNYAAPRYYGQVRAQRDRGLAEDPPLSLAPCHAKNAPARRGCSTRLTREKQNSPLVGALTSSPPTIKIWFANQPPPESADPTTERTTRTTTIRNHVNLKKDSLALERDARTGGATCRFAFDANLPCWVSVFVKVKDAPREGSRLTLTENRAPMVRVKRDAGLGQHIAVPISKADADALDGFLDADASGSAPDASKPHALVVRLECVVDALQTDGRIERGAAGGSADADAGQTNEISGQKRVEPPAPAGSALDARAQAQTTFASVEKTPGASAFAVSVLKQKIWVDGVSYELQEIFGIEHCSTGTPANADGADDDGESGKECVICMTEPRDTTALPCRHMCMCGACARMLRGQSNRCPICRTPVESLLEIKVASKDGE